MIDPSAKSDRSRDSLSIKIGVWLTASATGDGVWVLAFLTLAALGALALGGEAIRSVVR